MAIGNTGFSLQSKKLLRALRELEPVQPEDVALCRGYRPMLETEHHIRFAPVAIANRFSIEHGAAQARAFGFHGLWNMLYFKSDDEIKALLRLLKPSQWNNIQIDILGNRAIAEGRNDLFRHIIETRKALTGISVI